MSYLTKHRWAFVVLATVSCGSIALVAEDRPAKSPDAAEKSSKPQRSPMDSHTAACLILDNQNEVLAAQLAEQKSENKEVQTFAKMMQKDHQKFIAELEKFGGKELAVRLKSDSKTASEPDKNKPISVVARKPVAEEEAKPSLAGLQAEKMLMIKQEIADECLASLRKELETKSGFEFDACYVGMQIAAHMHMVDTLKVQARHASEDLKPVLEQGRETAQMHLDAAKKLMHGLDKGHASAAKKAE